MAMAVNSDNRNIKKDLLDTHVTIGTNSVEMSVLGKSGNRETVYVLRTEVDPLVARFGAQWDLFALTRQLQQENRKTGGTLFYRRRNGTAFTYSHYMHRLRKCCNDARLPAGSIGGHSGRIYKASLMAVNNANEATIKNRGRWRSDCWKIYSRSVRLQSTRPKQHTLFRIGDMNINIDDFPDADEFRRR